MILAITAPLVVDNVPQSARILTFRITINNNTEQIVGSCDTHTVYICDSYDCAQYKIDSAPANLASARAEARVSSL